MLDPIAVIRKLPTRFLSKIYAPLAENGCWNCVRPYGDGYGKTWYEGKQRRIHIIIYEICFGKVPQGLELDHLCKNPACVNPNHLEAVTHRVNVLRGESPAAKGARQTHCKEGHLLDGGNLRGRQLNAKGHRHCLICHRTQARNPNTERIWITDGTRNKTILRTVAIPENWWHGRTFSSSYWENFIARSTSKEIADKISKSQLKRWAKVREGRGVPREIIRPDGTLECEG